MNIHEYQAKELLRAAGCPVSDGRVVLRAEEAKTAAGQIDGPVWVVKAQIHAGGRGKGTFREDLLFRLNLFHIHLPPLRERRADIPELARHLLARAAKRPVAAVAELLTPEALDVMMAYHWQGNVRELANAMEYAWIVSAGQPITAQHLPYDVRAPRPAARDGGRLRIL